MPYVGGDSFQMGRKRRWEDDSSDGSRGYRLCGPEHQLDALASNQAQDVAARKTMPLANPKRARLAASAVASIPPQEEQGKEYEAEGEGEKKGEDGNDYDDYDDHEGVFVDVNMAVVTPTHRRLVLRHEQKAWQSHGSLAHRPELRPSTVLLTPCHICYRRPNKKYDLDSFAECQRCNRRTCFICIRECRGWYLSASVVPAHAVRETSFHMDDVDDMPHDQPQLPPPIPPLSADNGGGDDDDDDAGKSRPRYHGHGTLGHDDRDSAMRGHCSIVCSRCCVEKGCEGEAVCLGCLSSTPGS